MTPGEAREYLFNHAKDGGIYRQRFLFVFSTEEYEKTIAILEIADGGKGAWARNSGEFKGAGVTAYGPVSGLIDGYIVVGVVVRPENMFSPGYLQHVLNTVAHELVHAAQFSIKIQSYHDTLESVEPMAYMVGWLMEKWIYALFEKYRTTLIMAPAPALGTGMAYNLVFKKLYTYANQRLMTLANGLTPNQMYHALARETINSLNTTVEVEVESWSATTYFQGNHK
ncbi:hypothetical protein AH06_242 [Erwinia phage AH06]|nr:hypothetical protein AH06_242 [Erwinia phage AH06]